MKRILLTKYITNNPADGIDNIYKAILSKMPKNEVCFYAKTFKEFNSVGTLKKISCSRLYFIIFKKLDYLWGNGSVRDLLLLLLKPKKVKYIINFHTILIKDNGPWKSRTPWFVRKFIFSKASLIICPSKFSLQSVRNFFPNKKVISILNGVDLEAFNPNKKNLNYLNEKYKINIDSPLVVFIGSLQKRKRPDVFIKLAKLYKSANFIIVGRKSAEEDFLPLAKDLDNFKWIPKMSREDISILLASSGVFIFPSLSEPSAAVILEAMASGTVPILSESGGNGEFFGNGIKDFLIKYDNNEIDNFLKKLDALIKDKEYWIKESKIVRELAERHSFDLVVKEYKNIVL